MKVLYIYKNFLEISMNLDKFELFVVCYVYFYNLILSSRLVYQIHVVWLWICTSFAITTKSFQEYKKGKENLIQYDVSLWDV